MEFRKTKLAILSSIDNCSNYSHAFISNVCDIFWKRHTISNCGASNESVAVIKVTREWRGRCYMKLGFENPKRYPQKKLQSIEILLLHYAEVDSN